MKKFLFRYLLVTSIIGALVLMFPSLIIVGFLLFFVPGVILSVMPTAFMWGVIFSAFYFPASRVTARLAPLLAIACTAIILWSVPQWFSFNAQQTLDRYHLENVRPTERLAISGDIRLEGNFSILDGADDQMTVLCEEECMRLLLRPEITSVTVNKDDRTNKNFHSGKSDLEIGATTYRLAAKPKCSMSEKNVFLDDRYNLSPEMIESFATKFCLRSDLLLNHYSFLVRSGRWLSANSFGSELKRWDFPNDLADADFSEVRRADGQVIFRQFNLQATTLAAPLQIGGRGSLENYRLGWRTRTIPNDVSRDSNMASNALAKALNAGSKSPPSNDVLRWRTATRAIVASTNSELETRDGQEMLQRAIEGWLTALSDVADDQQALNKDDVELLKELLTDVAVQDLRGSSLLPKLLSNNQQADLRPLIDAKMKSGRAPQLQNVFSSWSSVLPTPDGKTAM